MLEVKNLNVFYDAIHAIRDVTFHVNQGEIVTLIGANGAGKTTILQTVSGLLKPRSGEITFKGENLRTMEAHRIVSLGLAQVPERRRIFTRMTVQDNLEMGAFARKDRDHLNEEYDAVFERFPRLKERRRQMAGTLSGGEQQMLAIGRAFMSGRRMMLLDEPSMGLAPLLMLSVFEALKEINAREGTAILLVEQNARLALKFAQRGYVLETGHLVLAGKSRELLNNPEIKAAYLGG